MERGAGGGAGERTLEQAFKQCVSGGRVMFERRVSGGRGALEQAFKQRVIRERERERERGRAGHRPSARACSPEASGVNSEVEPHPISARSAASQHAVHLEASRVVPSHGGEDGARGVFVALICSSDAAEGFASSDASEGVKGLEASECAHDDAEGDRGSTGGDRSAADAATDVVGAKPLRLMSSSRSSASERSACWIGIDSIRAAAAPSAVGRDAHDRFGAPAITFDAMMERPALARRELAAWLRGAGDASPSAGLSLVGGASGPEMEAPP